MLALARAWTASGGEAAFAKRRGPAGIDRQIAGANVASFLIDGDAGTGADAEQTARAASELAADWLVFDGYAFGPDYLDRLAGAAPRRMVLDDHGYADRFRVEALLNQNAGATAERYAESAPGVRLLLGPHYALLRPEFAANRRIDREPPPVARRIVVAMGGADPLGLTGRVLEALARPEAPRVEAVCLVGPANPRAGVSGRTRRGVGRRGARDRRRGGPGGGHGGGGSGGFGGGQHVLRMGVPGRPGAGDRRGGQPGGNRRGPGTRGRDRVARRGRIGVPRADRRAAGGAGRERGEAAADERPRA